MYLHTVYHTFVMVTKGAIEKQLSFVVFSRELHDVWMIDFGITNIETLTIIRYRNSIWTIHFFSLLVKLAEIFYGNDKLLGK